MSHPVWVCGLKLDVSEEVRSDDKVTPCMGVWIETRKIFGGNKFYHVTPCMGVWIETAMAMMAAL